jgi:hypothetical protein
MFAGRHTAMPTIFEKRIGLWSGFSGSVGSSARSVSHTERLATVVAPTLHRRTPDLVQRPITMRRRVVTWGSRISEELSRHVIMQGPLASF